MYTVDVGEAQGRLRQSMSDAAAGDDVVIDSEDGSSFRLVPVNGKPQRPEFGCARGLIRMSDDFDAPLEDFAPYER